MLFFLQLPTFLVGFQCSHSMLFTCPSWPLTHVLQLFTLFWLFLPFDQEFFRGCMLVSDFWEKVVASGLRWSIGLPSLLNGWASGIHSELFRDYSFPQGQHSSHKVMHRECLLNEWVTNVLIFETAHACLETVLSRPHLTLWIKFPFVSWISATPPAYFGLIMYGDAFFISAQQHPRSFLERTEEFAENVPQKGKCLHCPSFQSDAFYSHSLRAHCTSRRLEGTSKQSGFSAPFCTLLLAWEGGELCDPAHHVVSAFPDTCLPSRLTWQGPGHPLPCQGCEAGASKLHHLIAVCLGLVTELPFASVFPPIKWG